MKKVFSLILILILLASLAVTSVVAFAEDDVTPPTTEGGEGTDTEEPKREVTVNEAKALEYLNAATPQAILSMRKNFQFDVAWLKDHAKLDEVFTGLKHVTEGTELKDNDKLYVEYCEPSKDAKEEWTSVSIDSNFNLRSAGWWLFRVAVKDSAGNDVLARTPSIARYVVDNTNPEVELSSTQQDRVKEGLTVGSDYSISTSLNITDDSSTTTTYVVYKRENGDFNSDTWVKVYDSVSKEVTEGYENCISTSGTITPLNSDVNADKKAAYRIVYAVVDANGYYSVKKDENSNDKYDPEMLLFVSAAPVDEDEANKIQIWKIVLYVVAGLCAVGIVVLLCIKPKQQTAAEAPSKKEDKEKKD